MRPLTLWSSLFLLLLLACATGTVGVAPTRSFTIVGDDFVKDGVPFRIVSGAFHYFRTRPEQWADRLSRMKAGGLNTVETYIAWNLHEPQPGVYDFSGALDVFAFIEQAQSLDLLVIIRPPPFICAEWEYGGMPAWLQRTANVNVRSSDPGFLKPATAFLANVLQRLVPYQYSHGGPVIAMQIENEYGYYASLVGADVQYVNALYEVYANAGIDTVLFMSNGADDLELSGGALDKTLRTLNFGTDQNVNDAFRTLRNYQPTGPLFVTEFWDGWYDRWGDANHNAGDTAAAVATLTAIMNANASVNFYMYVGGTNFGFMNGANYKPPSWQYLPVTTSYDYGSPLTEYGNYSEKWWLFRDVLSHYVDVPDTPSPPPPKTRIFSDVVFSPLGTVFDNVDELAGVSVTKTTPETMAGLNQSYGYILYEATFVKPVGKSTLVLFSVKDVAWVFHEDELIGVVERNHGSSEAITVNSQQKTATIRVLVANMGRINSGPGLMGDIKGLGSATMNGRLPISKWKTVGIPLDTLPSELTPPAAQMPAGTPALFSGTFAVSTASEIADTFVNTSGLPGPGVLWINGFNLGRFDAAKGPQITLYLPSPLLQPGLNTLTFFGFAPEQSSPSPHLIVASFSSLPIFN